ncbi:hypothetical protein GGR56DRAFT_621260 [Xylariaceae sp. FL0804]|nr:hypothetical protein GGR56DRAFT_621260 [Xylariaceae sp. FL0804]
MAHAKERNDARGIIKSSFQYSQRPARLGILGGLTPHSLLPLHFAEMISLLFHFSPRKTLHHCSRNSVTIMPSPTQHSSSVAWSSLVRRSIEAWDSSLSTFRLAKEWLESCQDLDDLLSRSPGGLMFWFFQRREAFLAQASLAKWSRERLDDYLLLPALNGFVMRSECFFVSHFWRSKDHPDPDGQYLRLQQGELGQQPWSCIWVDWSCMPQHPRSQSEEAYFGRALRTVPGIIRNCGFAWFYPSWEARMWILFEVTEYALSGDGAIPYLEHFDDMKEYVRHINEMVQVGAKPVLDKYGYRCSFERDRELITAWMDFLVLLTRLGLGIGEIRRIMDHHTWFGFENLALNTTKGLAQIQRYDGSLELNGKVHTFTRFPKWVSSPSSYPYGGRLQIEGTISGQPTV